MLEIFTLSIADSEKLFDKADSSSFDLNTEFPAPVIATLTWSFSLATNTPTMAYLEAGLGYFT